MDAISLTPKTQKVIVGTRKMREVTIYPLSIADQRSLADLIAEVIRSFFSDMSEAKNLIKDATESATSGEISQEKADTTVDFISKIFEVIQENIVKIMGYVIDSDEIPKMDELTNEQLVEIASKIFEMNYEGSAKNVKSLLHRMKEAFRLNG